MSVKLRRRVLYGVICVCMAMVLSACGSDDDGGGMWALSRIDVDVDADGVVDVVELDRTFKGGRLVSEYTEFVDYYDHSSNSLSPITETSYTYYGDGTLDEMVSEYSHDISDTEHYEGRFVYRFSYFEDGRPSKIVMDQTLEHETEADQGSGYVYTQTQTYHSTTTQTPFYSQGKLYRMEYTTVSGENSEDVSYESREYEYDSQGRCTGQYSLLNNDTGDGKDQVTVANNWNSSTGLLDESLVDYDYGNNGIIDAVVTTSYLYDAGGILFEQSVETDTGNNRTNDMIEILTSYEECPLTFNVLFLPNSMYSLFGESSPNWYGIQNTVSKGYQPISGRAETWFLIDGMYSLQLKITEFGSNGLPEKAWMDYNDDGEADCIWLFTYVKL